MASLVLEVKVINEYMCRMRVMSKCLLAVIILWTCVACRETPRDEAVRNKTEFSTVSSAESSAVQVFPEWYTGEVNEKGLDVYFDAKVVGTNDAVSRVEVSPRILTQDMADRIIAALIGDSDIYANDPVVGAAYTREFYLDQITGLKILLGDEEFQKDANQVASANAMVSDYEALMMSAPSEESLPPTERVFVSYRTPENMYVVDESSLGGMSDEEKEEILRWHEEMNRRAGQLTGDEVISGHIRMGKDQYAALDIMKAENPFCSFVYFSNKSRDEGAVVTSPGNLTEIAVDGERLKSPDLDAASVCAEETLRSMQIGDYTLSRAGFCVSSHGVGDEKVYSFFFAPGMSGVSSQYVCNEQIQSSFAGNDVAFEEVWKQEYIQIDVSRGSVVGFYWNSPSEIEAAGSERVGLLPFQEVMRLAEQQFKNEYIYPLGEDVVRNEIHISEIVLSMMKVKERDSGAYVYKPVWDFVGYTNHEYAEGSQLLLDSDGKCVVSNFCESFLTLDAATGARISRISGY